MPESGSEHEERLEDAGETIHELRYERHKELPACERFVQALAYRLGRPVSLLVVAACIAAWVVVDLVLRPYHRACAACSPC